MMGCEWWKRGMRCTRSGRDEGNVRGVRDGVGNRWKLGMNGMLRKVE